jgi:hypothetical protein
MEIFDHAWPSLVASTIQIFPFIYSFSDAIPSGLTIANI